MSPPQDVGRHAPRLEVVGLGKDYGSTVALDGVELRPENGELLTILGPSGCGKTTLLRLIAGFDAPTRGQVRINGRVVSGEGIWVPPEQRAIGMVVQTYAVWPHMTVGENVAYPLKLRGRPRREIDRRVSEALDLVGLVGFAGRRPSSLSGGQQQRVALARAIVAEPRLLLLDEPLSNLDAQLREHTRKELRAIQQELGITTVLVTHDQAEAIELADRIVVMNDGRVQQAGAPEEVYRRPATAFVAAFLGAANVLPGRAAGGAWQLPDGALVAVPAAPPHDATALVIHPEDLRLLRDGRGAIVRRRSFAGAGITYTLASGACALVVDSREDGGPQPGDEVGLAADRVHYLTGGATEGGL